MTDFLVVWKEFSIGKTIFESNLIQFTPSIQQTKCFGISKTLFKIKPNKIKKERTPYNQGLSEKNFLFKDNKSWFVVGSYGEIDFLSLVSK